MGSMAKYVLSGKTMNHVCQSLETISHPVRKPNIKSKARTMYYVTNPHTKEVTIKNTNIIHFKCSVS